jgi:hypothetical protein
VHAPRLGAGPEVVVQKLLWGCGADGFDTSIQSVGFSVLPGYVSQTKKLDTLEGKLPSASVRPVVEECLST